MSDVQFTNEELLAKGVPTFPTRRGRDIRTLVIDKIKANNNNLPSDFDWNNINLWYGYVDKVNDDGTPTFFRTMDGNSVYGLDDLVNYNSVATKEWYENIPEGTIKDVFCLSFNFSPNVDYTYKQNESIIFEVDNMPTLKEYLLDCGLNPDEVYHYDNARTYAEEVMRKCFNGINHPIGYSIKDIDLTHRLLTFYIDDTTSNMYFPNGETKGFAFSFRKDASVSINFKRVLEKEAVDVGGAFNNVNKLDYSKSDLLVTD